MLQINPLRIVDVLWTCSPMCVLKAIKRAVDASLLLIKKNLQEVPVLAARLRAVGDLSVLSVLLF